LRFKFEADCFNTPLFYTLYKEMNFPSDIARLCSKLLENDHQYQEIHSSENLEASSTYWTLLHEIHNSTPSLNTKHAVEHDEKPD